MNLRRINGWDLNLRPPLINHIRFLGTFKCNKYAVISDRISSIEPFSTRTCFSSRTMGAFTLNTRSFLRMKTVFLRAGSFSILTP
jgi:hypothetical protein